jgi:transposase
VAALKPWLSARLELISHKSDLAKAIRYTLTHWEGLTRFLDDGRIELDTNMVERAIRVSGAVTPPFGAEDLW